MQDGDAMLANRKLKERGPQVQQVHVQFLGDSGPFCAPGQRSSAGLIHPHFKRNVAKSEGFLGGI